MELSNSIERFRANGLDDYKISKLTRLPLLHVRLSQKVINNTPSRRMSFSARDFNVSENELLLFGNYSTEEVEKEWITNKCESESFSERYEKTKQLK